MKQSKTNLLNIRKSPKGSCCLLMATAESNLYKFRYGTRNLFEPAQVQEVEETVFHLPHRVLLVKKRRAGPKRIKLNEVCEREKEIEGNSGKKGFPVLSYLIKGNLRLLFERWNKSESCKRASYAANDSAFFSPCFSSICASTSSGKQRTFVLTGKIRISVTIIHS